MRTGNSIVVRNVDKCAMDRFQYPAQVARHDAVPPARVRARSLRWLRGALTAAAAAGFVLMALFDERPLVMLVGLAPLALIASEAVWHALAGLDQRDSSAG
jgi:hypothetical protein